MPIRTARGRGAVYRRFWGWPLRSTKHLTATAVMIVLVAVGIGVAASSLGSHPTRTTTAVPFASISSMAPPSTTTAPAPLGVPTDSVSPSSGTTTSASTTLTPSTGTPDPTAQATAVSVASDFMTKWVNHPTGMTSQQWATQMTQDVMPEELAELETVDPNNVPATKITGTAQVSTMSPGEVQVAVPTDAMMVTVIVVQQSDGSWKVRSYNQAGN